MLLLFVDVVVIIIIIIIIFTFVSTNNNKRFSSLVLEIWDRDGGGGGGAGDENPPSKVESRMPYASRWETAGKTRCARGGGGGVGVGVETYRVGGGVSQKQTHAQEYFSCICGNSSRFHPRTTT